VNLIRNRVVRKTAALIGLLVMIVVGFHPALGWFKP
jgi:hypothetical protein